MGKPFLKKGYGIAVQKGTILREEISKRSETLPISMKFLFLWISTRFPTKILIILNKLVSCKQNLLEPSFKFIQMQGVIRSSFDSEVALRILETV